jgi:CheY-like chemotaxis protein
LVVEDNLINQRVLKRQLESRGCAVWTANNGKEAVEFIEKSSLNRAAGPDANEIEICFMVGHSLVQTVCRVADEGRIVKCP